MPRNFNGAVVKLPPGVPCTPAMACANEFSQVLATFLNLEPVDPRRPQAPDCTELWFISAIAFKQLIKIYESVRHLIPRNARVIGYVFDGYFSEKLKKSPSFVRDKILYTRRIHEFSKIYTPFLQLNDEHQSMFGDIIDYLPIGVDCLDLGGLVPYQSRYVDVNAYGRQPDDLVRSLSDRINLGRNGFFYFTSHMQIEKLLDPERHRHLFWNLLRHSKVSIAYSPESFDPYRRFKCSFLGQRWYESLAAGCVILGKRPKACEVDHQLDWADSTIELPDSVDLAVETITHVLADQERVESISLVNYRECLERHDWRARILAMKDFDDLIVSREYDRWMEHLFRIKN